MNWNWYQVKIVEEILKTAGTDGEIVCQRLDLAPEEYHRYRDNLQKRGLAVIVNGTPGILQLTDAGRALLRLIHDINAFFMPRKQVHALEQVVELEPWPPGCAERETLEWRDRIFEDYVLEQEKVERLEARLMEANEEEVRVELEQRYRRLGEMQRMMDNMGYVVRELREQNPAYQNNEDNLRLPSWTKRETVRVLADRLFKAYVLEQAELTRLEAQLRGIDDAEANQELEQRLQRLEVLKSLLAVLQRMIENQFM